MGIHCDTERCSGFGRKIPPGAHKISGALGRGSKGNQVCHEKVFHLFPDAKMKMNIFVKKKGGRMEKKKVCYSNVIE